MAQPTTEKTESRGKVGNLEDGGRVGAVDDGGRAGLLLELRGSHGLGLNCAAQTSFPAKKKSICDDSFVKKKQAKNQK